LSIKLINPFCPIINNVWTCCAFTGFYVFIDFFVFQIVLIYLNYVVFETSTCVKFYPTQWRLCFNSSASSCKPNLMKPTKNGLQAPHYFHCYLFSIWVTLYFSNETKLGHAIAVFCRQCCVEAVFLSIFGAKTCLWLFIYVYCLYSYILACKKPSWVAYYDYLMKHSIGKFFLSFCDYGI